MNFIVRYKIQSFLLENLIEILVYMDNQTLCNQGLIHLDNIHIGRIFSHIDYHVNKYKFRKEIIFFVL